MGYYASVPMPGTIGEVMTAVAQRYDIEMPLADLFLLGHAEAAASTTSPRRCSSARRASAASTPTTSRCASRAWTGRSGSSAAHGRCRSSW